MKFHQHILFLLNQIYNPVGESWQVEVDEDFVYEELPDFFEKSSNLLSAYTEAMKAFQSKYASERTIDEKTTYLFFFNTKAGDRNVNGFMPRNKQFGYIFTQGFSDEEHMAIAVAHELGHGQFLLKHPFDNSYKLLQNGLPENLMDYGNGVHLAKWQWDIIKSPGVVNRVFEREGDAMTRESRVPEIINTIRAAKEEEQELSLISGTLYTSEHTKIGDVEYKDIAIQVKKRGEQIVINKVKVHSIDTSDQQSGSHFDINVRDQNSGVSNPWYTTITLRSREERRKLLEYLQEKTVVKPRPGDPLVNMEIQGTDEYNSNNRIGGMYGCVRSSNKEIEQNCDIWESNIINFPHIDGKNKVHDGLDLKASTGTPVYAMFAGKASVGYSQSLGYYVLIESSKEQHGLDFEKNIIFISYGHLSSYENSISEKTIKQGDLIGYTGNSGSIAQQIEKWQFHLHLTIYRNNTNKFNRINPIDYITTKFDKYNGNKIK